MKKLADKEKEKLLDKLILEQINSCTCAIKTTEIKNHKDDCKYRILLQAHLDLKKML
jgi:hypothetical protein